MREIVMAHSELEKKHEKWFWFSSLVLNDWFD